MRATNSTSRGSQRARRRGADLEDALLEAAWDVLVNHGYNGFTYEAVADRAGTSRPVLYRRWPRHDDLLLATLRRHWRPVPVPDTGSMRGDALQFLSDLSRARTQLTTILTVQLHDYFVGTGTSLGDLRAALRASESARPFGLIVDRAVARGELPARDRPARMIELPFDLLRHEMLMTLRPVPAAAIEQIVDDLWIPLLRLAR